jgi:hypothetical protein
MTKVGALTRMVTDGREIFFLDSNEPRMIADAITAVLADSPKLQLVSDAALSFVREKFNFKSTSKVWDLLLSEFDEDRD